MVGDVNDVMSWSKANVPLYNESVDATKPTKAAKSVVNMVLGATLLFAVMGGGQMLYNRIASRTPDGVQSVEVF